MGPPRGYTRLPEAEKEEESKDSGRWLRDGLEPQSRSSVQSLELRSRGGGSRNPDPTGSNIESTSSSVACLERPLNEGDSLQKIALQYSLPVAELKRLNNLINEQDLYGRSFIRIPVKQYSHVEELIGKGLNSAGLSRAGAEESLSEGSDAFLPLSDTEEVGDWNKTKRGERSENCSPTASLGSPTNENLRDYRKMIRSVDASLEKAKTITHNLVERDGFADEAIFNGDEGELWGPRAEPNSGVVDQNLGRYLIGVLVSFAIIGALGYIMYELVS